MPTRRQFLRIGGLAIPGAAILAACGGDEADEPVPEAPDEPEEQGISTDGETDVVLANTALSLEVLLVDAYQAALDFALVGSDALVEAVTLFQGHHAEHRDALVAVVEAAGGEPFTVANPVVKAAFVDPALASVATEADFARFAFDLEQSTAQTYVHAATSLSTPPLRSTAITIGGVESRHAAILDRLADLGNRRLEVYPTDSPLPSDAIVTG